VPSYRALDDGSYEVDTPAGPLRTALSPEQLQWAGYEPPPVDPMAGATAANDYGSEYGIKNVLDAPAAPFQVPLRAPPPSPTQGATPGVAALVRGSQGPLQPQSTEAARGAAQEALEQAKGKPRLPEGTAELELNLGPRGQSGGGAGFDPGRPTYHTTKARDQRTSFQVQKGNEPLRDETSDQLADQNIDAKLRMQEQADKDEQRGRQQSEMYERDVVTPLERDEIEQRRRVQYVRTETTKRLDELKRDREAIDRLEVDPDKIYEGREWARALAFLSVLAGGALQGKNGGGSNPGLDGMNDAINRSIAVQKENYQRKREGLAAKETEFDRLMKIYGDPQLAEEELRNRHEAVAAAYAKKFAMDVGTEDVQANLAAGMGDLDRKLIDNRLKLDQQLSDKVVENYSYIPAQTYQVGGRRPGNPEARKRKVNVDGVEGYVVSDGQQRPVQEQIDTLGFLASQIQEYRATAANTSLGPDEKKRKLRSLKTNIGTTAAIAQGQGAMSKDEQNNLPATLGNPDDLLGANENDLAAIDATGRFYNEKRKRIVQSNVYADPDATTPLFRRAPASRPDE
jgi:hypothetical protein